VSELTPIPSFAAERKNLRQQRQLAAKARWSKQADAKADWETMPLDEAKAALAEMRADAELGARIIQERIGKERPEQVCAVCGTVIKGLPAQIVPVRTDSTGLWDNIFYCSAECVVRRNQKQSGILSLAK
jgi:hypothetical protein